MKAVYDKLLFILALLILAGSVTYFFFVAQSDSAEQRGDKILSQAPKGASYVVIDAPQFERNEIPWPAPYPQDADGNWLFDVFTPPRIYWDRVASQFVSEPWQPPLQAPPFALELIAMDQELFRIQMEAYFANASGKPEDAILQFIDTESETSFRGNVGTVFENQKLRVDGFEVDRKFNPDGSVLMVGTATVTDLLSGEQFVLNTSQRLYVPGSFNITMRTTSPLPVETFSWKEAGETRTVADAVFVLNAFDLDAKTVTVTKTSPQLEEAEQAVLNVTATPVTESAPEAPAAQGEMNNNTTLPSGFEGLFN